MIGTFVIISQLFSLNRIRCQSDRGNQESSPFCASKFMQVMRKWDWLWNFILFYHSFKSPIFNIIISSFMVLINKTFKIYKILNDVSPKFDYYSFSVFLYDVAYLLYYKRRYLAAKLSNCRHLEMFATVNFAWLGLKGSYYWLLIRLYGD